MINMHVDIRLKNIHSKVNNFTSPFFKANKIPSLINCKRHQLRRQHFLAHHKIETTTNVFCLALIRRIYTSNNLKILYPYRLIVIIFRPKLSTWRATIRK